MSEISWLKGDGRANDVVERNWKMSRHQVAPGHWTTIPARSEIITSVTTTLLRTDHWNLQAWVLWGRIEESLLGGHASLQQVYPGWAVLHDINVKPGFRSRGVGSALLRRVTEVCDEERMTCWLTAVKPEPVYMKPMGGPDLQSLRFFYERSGWEILEDNSPRSISMSRTPR